MKLQTGSRAIDAADAKCDVTDDQRGVARPQPTGGRCDIGAYEVKQTAATPSPTPTAVPSPPVTGTGGGDGPMSLTGLLVGLTALAGLAAAGLGMVARNGRA